MKLLHIIATPRENESRTLKVSRVFLEEFKSKFPQAEFEELNLFKEALPPLTVKRLDGKYILLGGGALSEEYKSAWDEIVKYIEQFLSADIYLVSVPMWNFSIPYVLKHYIDVIIQPRYMFNYTESGPVGLVKNKQMVVITSRGGDYSQEGRAMDFQEPYLKAVFSLVGITDITFINAQPMDAEGEKVRNEKIEEANKEVKKVVSKL